MAQDLFFIPLNKTFKAKFDRSLICSILSKGATQPVTTYACAYPDGSHGEADGLEDKSEMIDILGFGHFGGRMMMERIYDLADAFEVVLVWTDVGEDEPNACVAGTERLAVARELVDDLRVVVARDASHLNQLVKGATFEEMGW